jgi:hypothetical protein
MAVHVGGHRVGEAVALNAIGYHHIRLGAPWCGMWHCHRASPIRRDLSHPHGEAATWDSLGIAHLLLGQLTKAQRCLLRVLAFTSICVTGSTRRRH